MTMSRLDALFPWKHHLSSALHTSVGHGVASIALQTAGCSQYTPTSLLHLIKSAFETRTISNQLHSSCEIREKNAS